MKTNNSFGTDDENIDQWLHDTMNDNLSVKMTTLPDAAMNAKYDHTKMLMCTIVDYKELMMMYTCAMKEIQTKFEILNTEYKVCYQRNR